MNELDELLTRLTIDFPHSITSDEVESGLLPYLQREVCDVAYTISIQRHKDERYVSGLRGVFRNGLVVSGFEMDRVDTTELPLTFFSAIKFSPVPGYDSVQEFKELPTGEQQLTLIDLTRRKTEKYFSLRPK